MTDMCVLGPTSPHRSDGSKGPGGSSPAAWLPVHHLHSGHHQKRPSQTHHSAGAAVPQRHGRCQSAAHRRSPGGQLASVPERDPAHCTALWCGGVLSLTGHRSRRLPGRKKYRITIQCAKYRRFRGVLVRGLSDPQRLTHETTWNPQKAEKNIRENILFF